MLSSGEGLGQSNSETGSSTSMVPTLCGPVYSGKPGTGLRRDRYEVISAVSIVRNEIQG
jgi:hypothetical protein